MNMRILSKSMFAHYAVNSHTGKIRSHNEDSFCARPDLGLWVVADGMGGHEMGQMASNMACELICQQIEQGENVLSAIHYAHLGIKDKSLALGQTKPMGTTVVLLHHTQSATHVYWVGDSRAYLVQHDNVQQITTDHSLVQKLLERHLITEQEAASHPRRNIITQSLGMMSNDELDIGKYTINKCKDYSVLLCSDGLSNELSDNEIYQISKQRKDLDVIVNELVSAANNKGGRDNITAMLVKS